MRHLDDGTLQAFLDGHRSGLDASELAEIERHLSGCEVCSRRLDDLDELSHRVEGLLAESAPAREPMPEYAAIVDRARGRPTEARPRSRWGTAAWAASVAAAVMVGWLARDVYHGARPASSSAEREKVAATPAAARAARPEAPGKPVADSPAPAQEPSPGVVPAVPIQVASQPVSDTSSSAGAAATSPSTASPTAAPERVANAAPRQLAADVAPAGGVDSALSQGIVIQGRVTDETGRPLTAAQVSIEGTGVGALTAADGTFRMSLDSLPADSAGRAVTVTAEMPGYRNGSRTVIPREGQSISADLRLAQQAVALDEIVVTGESAGPPAGPGKLPELVVRSGEGAPGWRAVRREDAEAETGFPLLIVSDLPVLRVEVRDTVGVVLARVVQELVGGGHIELVEARRALRFDATTVTRGHAQVSVQRGDVFVLATAPLDASSLRSLLDRVR